MSPAEITGLTLAAAAGGAINAVAGGGTLVTFPTLLAFGTPPVVANATSTLALALGTGGSVYGYRAQFPAIKPWLWRFVPISLLGALIGGVLLTRTTDKTFSKLVPFLILFATLLFLGQGTLRRFAGPEPAPGRPHPQSVLGAVLFQLAVAIYGGYFGAGIGILMLASLGFIGLGSIHEMNALKSFLALLINLVAATWFIYSGLIHWPKAVVMTLGALGGYYFGSHYSQKIPAARVRQLITAIGLLLSVATFWKAFG